MQQIALRNGFEVHLWIYDPGWVPAFISLRYHFTLKFFLVEHFSDFSSEAKLGISVPYLSSKNCAFPALRPNWKVQTVGKSVFTNCIKLSNLVYLAYSGSLSHPWNLLLILFKLKGFFCFLMSFWVLPAKVGREGRHKVDKEFLSPSSDQVLPFQYLLFLK